MSDITGEEGGKRTYKRFMLIAAPKPGPDGRPTYYPADYPDEAKRGKIDYSEMGWTFDHAAVGFWRPTIEEVCAHIDTLR